MAPPVRTQSQQPARPRIVRQAPSISAATSARPDLAGRAVQLAEDPAQMLQQDGLSPIQRQQMALYLGQGVGNRQLRQLLSPDTVQPAVQLQAAPAPPLAKAPQTAQAEPKTSPQPERELSWGERAAKWAFEKALAVAGAEPGQVKGLVSRAGGAVMAIVREPGRFLGALIRAIGQGFTQFKDNIGKHLQTGLLGWLFGTMARAGIEAPKDFSARSILALVLQILGITAERLKQKAARLIGEKNVCRIEKAWDILSTFLREGLGGLWEMLKEYLSDLQQTVIEEVKSWVITQVIQAAVVKVLSLFNPVSGLISIVKAIYNVVQFLIERAGQIAALFQAIAGSVAELALGNIKGAADKVEQALARVIPVAIGFLASLLGIGGIADKIKGIVQKVQQRVDQAIDKAVIKIIGSIRKISGKEEIGKDAKQETIQSGLQAGLSALHTEEAQLATDGGVSRKDAEKIATDIQKRHPIFASIRVVDGGEYWDYAYTLVQRTTEHGKKPKAPEENLHDIDFGTRPSFRPSTRRALPVRAGEHRRHLVAFDALQMRLRQWVQNKTIAQAAQILQRLLKRHGVNQHVVATQAGIVAAGRTYLRQKLNDLRNLRVGPARENVVLGSRSRHAKAQVEQALRLGDHPQFELALIRLQESWLDESQSRRARPVDRNVIDITISYYRREFARQHGKSV